MNRPTHFEILSENPDEVAEFYKTVLGWEIAVWDGPQKYWLVNTGDEGPGINGAIMHRQFDQPVVNTMEVESLEAMTKTVEENGGKIVHGPSDIPGTGRHAYFADPEGNLFGLIEMLPKP